MDKTFFDMEREAAQYRVDNEIGVLKVYDEAGALHHTEETTEYKQAVAVLRCDSERGEATVSRKQSHEPLYFKAKPKKATVSYKPCESCGSDTHPNGSCLA